MILEVLLQAVRDRQEVCSLDDIGPWTDKTGADDAGNERFRYSNRAVTVYLFKINALNINCSQGHVSSRAGTKVQKLRNLWRFFYL